MAHYDCKSIQDYGYKPDKVSLLFTLDYDFTKGIIEVLPYPGKMTRDGRAGSSPMLHTVVQPKQALIIVPLYKNTSWIRIGPSAFLSTELIDDVSVVWLNLYEPKIRQWHLICTEFKCREVLKQNQSGDLLAENPKTIFTDSYILGPWQLSGCVTDPDSRVSSMQAMYRENRWKTLSHSIMTMTLDYAKTKRVDLATYVVSDFPTDMEDLYWQHHDTGMFITENRITSNIREAYCDAASKMPQQTMNIIANILDIISLFKDPKALLKIKSLSDLWLKYRYVYSTTKSDVNDTRELLNRLKDLSSRKTIKVSGTFTESFEDTIETYRFVGKYSVANFLTGTLSASNLEQYFGKIRIEDIWDVIPFSFMADWLTNIGNNLSNLDSYCELLNMTPIETWATMSRTVSGQMTTERHFMRLRNYKPIGFPKYAFSKGPSDTTILSRVTDVVSIFGG